jgi:hypothetical protein
VLLLWRGSSGTGPDASIVASTEATEADTNFDAYVSINTHTVANTVMPKRS